MSNETFLSRRNFAAAAAVALTSGFAINSAFAATKDEDAKDEKAEKDGGNAAEKGSSGMTLEQLQKEAIPQASLANQDTPETRGEVDATRTYVLQNATDGVVTQLYVYETGSDDKGKNLAGDGLQRGEQVEVTVTGGYIGTDAETLFTCEYVVDDTDTYEHDTLHVEDYLFGGVIYLVGADGVSSATPLSFNDSNL